MALFQKQVNCPSDKAITMCGTTDRTMRLMPVRHNRIGTFAENKLRLVPTTMCRRTVWESSSHRFLAILSRSVPNSLFFSGYHFLKDTDNKLPISLFQSIHNNIIRDHFIVDINIRKNAMLTYFRLSMPIRDFKVVYLCFNQKI